MLLIKNTKLFTMGEAGYINDGDVLIKEGKFIEIGRNLFYPDARVIDAHGLYAMPGIIDAHCHIGMWEDGMGQEGADGNEESDPVTPQMRALDAVNPVDRCFTEAYQGGVTTVATGPGSANVIGGQFIAMKTHGKTMRDMTLIEPLALKGAFGENPKTVYSQEKKSPRTRMATAAIMREAFISAREYARKLSGADESKRPERNLKLEALASVLSRELPMKMHAHRADDILTALRIAEEFNIRVSIDHCTEGYLILDDLKKAGVMCILGPLLADRSKIELRNLTFKALKAFYEAGVKFALMTDHPVIPIQYLRVEAGIAVSEGLPEYEALKCITINAAEAIGLSDRLGAIDIGKDADIALFEGHPLDGRSREVLTVIDGEIVYER